MEFKVSNCSYLCVSASIVLQTDSKVERWRCRESKLTVACKRTHTIVLCHFRNLCRQSSTEDKFVGFYKTHFFSRMFVGFKQKPICQKRVCNTCEELLHTFNIQICTHKTRLEVELLCSCSLTSTVVQGNAMKLTKNLMRCVHLEDIKTLWENHKLTMMEYERHYVDVHSMSCLMVEPFLFHSP
jgi:hypothetical protein